MTRHVEADPYPWPYNGDLRPDNTVVLIIDMQTDFCGKGGYVDAMGYDLSLTRAPIIQDVLGRAKLVSSTLADIADLSDLPANKRGAVNDGRASALDLAGGFWIRGRPGWKSFPNWRRFPFKAVIGKPGRVPSTARTWTCCSIAEHPKHRSPASTDVCVHDVRDANDRGYECLLLSDCTGATDYGNHLAALKMITMQGGVFGAVADSRAFIKAMS